MSDIFLSYASEDRDTAERLAAALAARGWSVWWDRQIPFGRPFDGEIERALAEARCVIVLWSRSSVASDWVKTEAAEARERRVLLPVAIEEVKPPLEFRRLQTGALIGWSGDASDEAFERLAAEVVQALTRPSEPVPPAPAGGWAGAPRRPRWRLAVALLPTAVAIVVGASLAVWRLPTSVRLTLPVSRVAFTLAEGDLPLVRILDALAFPAITIERFEQVTIDASRVERADPAQYILAEDRYPESAWTRVEPGRDGLRFEALDERLLPSVTFEREPGASGPIGTLRPVVVPAPSEVTLDAGEPGQSLGVSLSHPRPSLAIPMTGSVRVTAVQARLPGPESAPAADQAGTWRVELRDGGNPIAVTGRAGALVASITLPVSTAGGSRTVFSAGTIPIDAIDFSAQDPLGRRVSSVVADGALVYRDRPDQARTIERSSAVTLGQLRQFSIRHVSVRDEGGLQIELEGIAGMLVSQRGPERVDHRLTALAVFGHRPAWQVSSLLVWLFATLGLTYPWMRGTERW